MKNKISRLQFSLLCFSFLYGSALLSPGVFGAGSGAWIASLLGGGAGILWLMLISRAHRTPLSHAYCIALCILIVFLLFFNLADFGSFWQSRVNPSLPAPLCALLLLTAALYAALRGESALGRFSQLCPLLLLPLIFILFLDLGKGELSNLIPQSGAFSILKSSAGYFLSSFGDGVALCLLIPHVVSLSDGQASVFANACAKASPLPKPKRTPKHPESLPLFLGTLGAAVLFSLTVLTAQAGMGTDALQQQIYPISYASQILHGGMLDPLFTFCLTLLYTVKISLLLLVLCRLLATRIPKKYEKALPLLPSALLLAALLLLLPFPSLVDSVRFSPVTLGFLALFALILPLFHTFSIILKKRFDKTEKT